MKDTIIDFFSNMVSVILGIVITFAVQGKIDRLHDRKEVASALDLVRTELSANIQDIQVMSGYLHQEKKAADYFLEHRDMRKDCPEDSILYHSGLLFADASITVSHDALELLKNSSLFQKIGNNDLSMRIIRAYDTSASIVANMNRHLSERNERFDKSVTAQTAGQFTKEGNIDIRKFIKAPFGIYAVQWVANQPGPELYNDVSDIEAALSAIDAYLH